MKKSGCKDCWEVKSDLPGKIVLAAVEANLKAETRQKRIEEQHHKVIIGLLEG